MKIYLGSDHAGFKFKQKLSQFLKKQNIAYEDLGPKELTDGDDYPDYAFKVAEKVSNDRGSEGLLICGSGAGMVIAANKVKRVRAVLATDIYGAISAKTDDDANILCLRSRRISFQKVSKIVSSWLKARFRNRDPYLRRVKKVEGYEKK